MQIYDENFYPINNYDPTMGRLELRTRKIHVDAIEPVEEQGHWKTLKEYPETGGKDVAWVVDVPGVQGQEAVDNIEEYYLYIPFTSEEMEQQNNPSLSERIAAQEEISAEQDKLLMQLLYEVTELNAGKSETT